MAPTILAEPASALYDAYAARLRAGRVQDAGAVIVRAVPCHPKMTVTETSAQLDKLKGWLDSFRPFPPSVVAELKRYYDVRFTYHSNAIEGNTLTQSETEIVLEQGLTVGGKTLAEHLEAVGHRDAIGFIEEMARKGTPVGEWEVRQVHALVLRLVDQVTGGDDAGCYRTLDVRAAGTDHLYPPHYEIPERMEAFVAWLASDDVAALHPVARAAETHYRFVSVHPFRDGNGRTARLLMNLTLLRDGYPVAVIPRERRAAYIDAFAHAQSNADDTAPLTLLVADACRESLIEYLRVLSTAPESRGRGRPFYDDLLTFLSGEAGGTPQP
jgi:Fic family protein